MAPHIQINGLRLFAKDISSIFLIRLVTHARDAAE